MGAMEHEDKDVIVSIRTQHAFTLIELLLALAVSAILMAVAAPSLKHALTRNRVIQADNQMVSALNLSRIEAINHGTYTILCPSSDGIRCQPGQNWEGGWLMGIDENHDFQPDAAPEHVFGPLAEGIRVHSSRGRLRVRYQPDGSAPGSNISLVVCHAGQPQSALKVVVSNSGRPRQGTASARQARACSDS